MDSDSSPSKSPSSSSKADSKEEDGATLSIQPSFTSSPINNAQTDVCSDSGIFSPADTKEAEEPTLQTLHEETNYQLEEEEEREEKREDVEDLEYHTQKEDGTAKEKDVPPITKLMQRTGYPIVQQNGQRRYGPPPDWSGASPQRGCEVFVGKIPRDCFEDELVPVFEGAGKIYEMRLMVDFSGFNRGYAFVVYTNQIDSKKSVKLFNNYEIRKGRLLGVCMSIDNCRLFIGGIPKRVVRSDIMEEIKKVTEGVRDVIVYPSASDKSKNRGFAFVEYDSHRSAAMARKKLISGRIHMWGHSVAVDWAEPEIEVEDSVMSSVKVIYVRNLMLSTTESHLEEIFSGIAPVERVKKIRDYAFIHFSEREGALKSIELMNEKEIDGTEVEITLAKPVDKDTLLLHRQARRNRTYLPHSSLAPIAYLPIDYSSLHLAPIYGNGHSIHTNTSNEPRGFMPSRGRGRSYSRVRPNRPFFPVISSPGCRQAGCGNGQGQTRYECGHVEYGYHSQEGGGTHLSIPSHVHGHSSKVTRSPVQLLEEVCLKNHWGIPIYSLHTAATCSSQGEGPLYYYKVVVSGLNLQFQSNKLSRTIEDAKQTAASYVMSQIGCPLEGVSTASVAKVPKIWDSAAPVPPFYQSTYQPGSGSYHHPINGAGIWTPKGPGSAIGL